MTDHQLLLHATRFQWICPTYQTNATLERRSYHGQALWFLLINDAVLGKDFEWYDEVPAHDQIKLYTEQAGFGTRAEALEAYHMHRHLHRPPFISKTMRLIPDLTEEE